ncbi:MAG TPA: inositol monophosphatase family protein [Salinisphaeraceae bacterium]|nr:inositol monophosphatase family protein [Salinisphaeraceae bacterium]
MHAYTHTAISAARRAGGVILQYYRRGETGDVQRKAENDYVTEADQRAEEVIIDSIQRAYPEHAIRAEESGRSGDSRTVWIIDPIDGTANFMHGIPHFCVSIACQIDGVIEHGVVYDPVKDELFTADRDAGAQLDQRRIRVSGISQLRHAMLATGFAYRKNGDVAQYLPVFNRLLAASGDIRRGGSAALDLAYVACGRLDGYWELGLSPWDVAAGMLLVEAAGGLVSDPFGGDALETGHIVAATPKLHPLLAQRISSTPTG